MQVSKSVHALRHPFTIAVSPGNQLERFVYSLVIFGQDITLVDSGVKGCEERIFSYIRAQGRRPDEIKQMVLSHAHPDHIGSAYHIKEATGCRVYAHALEKDWMEHIERQHAQRPVPGFFDLVDASIPLDGCLAHEQILDAGQGLSLQFLHAPGHSKGSLSLWVPEEKVLFTADCIPVPMDIPNYDNFRDLLSSLRLLRGFRDVRVMLSSWADPLYQQDQMEAALASAERYLAELDAVVKQYYLDAQADMECCRAAVAELGLPPVFVIPLVHRAFLSHIV